MNFKFIRGMEDCLTVETMMTFKFLLWTWALDVGTHQSGPLKLDWRLQWRVWVVCVTRGGFINELIMADTIRILWIIQKVVRAATADPWRGRLGGHAGNDLVHIGGKSSDRY